VNFHRDLFVFSQNSCVRQSSICYRQYSLYYCCYNTFNLIGRTLVIVSNKLCLFLMLNDTSCQFHQHFTNEFFVQTSFWQLFSSYMYVMCTWKKLLKWHSYEKRERIKLMKLTVGLQGPGLNIIKLLGAHLGTQLNWFYKARRLKVYKIMLRMELLP